REFPRSPSQASFPAAHAPPRSGTISLIPTSLSKIQLLSDTECLVCLQAEPPLRMLQAIIHRACGVFDHVRAVHRLQRKTLEVEAGKVLRRPICLRTEQFEFIPALNR